MSNQSKVCRLILDFSDIITNQVFTELQAKLNEKGFTSEESSEVYASVGRTVSANVRTLIDNVVRTYEE
tara:strand:- start:109 stop:315 length:207 start_codon:yes stop_codon:yes gene_type:complete